MNEYVAQLERELALIERGFKEEQRRAQADYHSFDREHAKALAHLAYRSQVYQVRMYAVFLLGHLSQEEEILNFLRDEVSKDDNWRVQEVLAKAVDEFCATRGYEQALGVIDQWLNDARPHVRRAVTEGLRIWSDSSEYVRKSVGNALRDISKKFPDLVAAQLGTWSLQSREVKQVHSLASKFIK